jgi:deltex
MRHCRGESSLFAKQIMFPQDSMATRQSMLSLQPYAVAMLRRTMALKHFSDPGVTGANVRHREESNHDGEALSNEESEDVKLPQDFAAKAFEFADAVASNHRRLLMYDRNAADMNANNFSPIAVGSLAQLAIRLFETQANFRRLGKDTHVDVGYHYTKVECMERICGQGLLTKAERQATNNSSESNGATFGDGIYTSANPFSYHKFKGGDQGLFVARIRGLSRVGPRTSGAEDSSVDTLIGRYGESDEVWVLQSSVQAVPLVKFASDLVELDNDASVGNAMVYTYHCSLQKIIDDWFNGGAYTPVAKRLPSQVNLRGYGLTRVITFQQLLEYCAPETLRSAALADLLIPVPHEAITNTIDECSICLNCFSDHGPVVRLPGCFHQFHKACVEMITHESGKCPNCRHLFAEPQGSMPSGTMQIQGRSDLKCEGFGVGTIAITYEIDAGIQKEYHENPGQGHHGTVRAAFIPDCLDGRKLLKRLKFAFLHGLTFTVGTSLTSGRTNAITWASIHHKTRLDRGPHGYPDPSYFANVNEELDALHVPAANDLVD